MFCYVCEWQPHDDADCRDQEAKLNFRETFVVTVVVATAGPQGVSVNGKFCIVMAAQDLV